MNLLLTRSQARSLFFSLVPLRIGGTVTFKLKSEFEFTKEEHALLRRYSFDKATLISSNIYDDLARAFKPAWLIGLAVMIVTAFVIATSPGRSIPVIVLQIMTIPIFGILSVVGMTVIYFFSLRKNITVAQLMNGGRTFYCHSVVELDEQEHELKDLAHRLHLTLEKAKNWGGREINPIPDGEPIYLPDNEISQNQSKLERGMHSAGAALGKALKPASNKPEDKPQASLPSKQTPSEAPSPHPFAPKPNDPPTDGA